MRAAEGSALRWAQHFHLCACYDLQMCHNVASNQKQVYMKHHWPVTQLPAMVICDGDYQEKSAAKQHNG